MSNDGDSKLIRPPTSLNDKVTIGGPGAVDETVLQKAEQVITDLADEYVDWAKEDMVKLQKTFAALKSGEGDQEEALDAVFQVAHDIKGQGGSFDYQLMTIISNQLCRFIESLEGETNRQALEVIELHINSLIVVISEKLTGDGGDVGDRMLMGLEMVLEKRMQEKSQD